MCVCVVSLFVSPKEGLAPMAGGSAIMNAYNRFGTASDTYKPVRIACLLLENVVDLLLEGVYRRSTSC